MRTARIVVALTVPAVAGAAAALGIAALMGDHAGPGKSLGLVAICMGLTTFQLTYLGWVAGRDKVPVVSLQLDGDDDALMRHAAALLRARGIAAVHVDRPSRSVLGPRVRIRLEPDERQPLHWHVTVRARPLFAVRGTDWDEYRALAESIAGEFRTMTAGTR